MVNFDQSLGGYYYQVEMELMGLDTCDLILIKVALNFIPTS